MVFLEHLDFWFLGDCFFQFNFCALFVVQLIKNVHEFLVLFFVVLIAARSNKYEPSVPGQILFKQESFTPCKTDYPFLLWQSGELRGIKNPKMSAKNRP